MAYTSFIFGILFLSFTTLLTTGTVNVLLIDQYAPFVFKINTNYLSIGLDSSVIASNFKNFNMSDPKLVKIIGHLSPAYLRVGGNMADCLIFQSNNKRSLKENIGEKIDGGDCSYSNDYCQYQVLPNFTMNGIDWLNLNNLTRNAKLDMIFDLNVLRRFPNNSWNPENAKQLIEFSNRHNLDISWQLGNEPNAFRHQFNRAVNATQLAMDFQVLKKILNKYRRYEKSLLIGPETTRPQAEKKDSITYMTEFLKNAGNIIDIISWHQYYFNGRTASAHDFLDPKIFDILTWQIDTILEIQKRFKLSAKRVWLTETSSAWGGGSPLYSDRFIGSFIWLDKLGLAAKKGIDVVVRQSIFSGYYALIANDYIPNPVSVTIS
ncbi:hypothetical protein WA026_013901 [Henosepilachna vigintioctopunctata]|uniref:Heparanase-like n=1 Tax=Henosepilachna vigintioctopunctata TaxID=420089 RepID=A0AAW1U8D1_9CUCU